MGKITFVSGLILTGLGLGSSQAAEAPADEPYIELHVPEGAWVPPPIDPASAAAPKVIYLFWADGVTDPGNGYPGCSGIPPKFVCGVGSTEECQKRTQALLDKWYWDFDVVFTYKKPAGGMYYTISVTDHGYCGLPAQVAGIAPGTCTNDYGHGEIAYAWHKCATDANYCAGAIAQEQAHMVGLMHISGSTDVMNFALMGKTTGFLNESNATMPPGEPKFNCRTTQNSYEMMKAALGPRVGDTKTGPFGDVKIRRALRARVEAAAHLVPGRGGLRHGNGRLGHRGNRDRRRRCRRSRHGRGGRRGGRHPQDVRRRRLYVGRIRRRLGALLVGLGAMGLSGRRRRRG